MTISALQEKIRYLYEHTDFADTIFDGLIGYAVIAADFDGTIIAYNAGASIIYGYTQEEVIGRLGLDCIFTHKFKETGGIDGIFDNLLKNRRYSIDVENIRKSGEVFPAKMVLTLVRSKDGKELGLVIIVQDLTEIKQAEDEVIQLNQFLEQKVLTRTAQLQESEERFRSVAESAGDAIICLKQPDTIYLWNKKAQELFGYSAEEAIGKFLHQVIVPERLRSDAYSGLERFTRSGIGPIVGKQIEISALRKDGTEFPVELSVSAMKVGDEWHATGIIRDITERKQAETALKESENKFRSLFGNMLAGFAYCKMLLDDHDRPDDFVYLDVNATFSRLTGLKNVLGKKVTEIIPGIKEMHPELFDIYGRVALTGEPERFEIYFKPLAIWLTISAYSTEKGYFAAVFDNITERKQAEDKLNNYISELERFKKATIQREFRIKELKERLERLEKK